ncbi:efflux RND transporter periplasmic adaptor subunit [Gillisia limnaea]|uniref:Efflux transporter, RND family, MFP subunit n=2 Tax=Gillisia TaxID=244698 RepID=H2BWR8_GILLR|nr:efflux RND transporter periplasmic adaptor subunit [Gillisia limnaea]EHQ03046.1 efflux transporter, RND family, MFP subunit [Gillisia limnaea DSM 15749]
MKIKISDHLNAMKKIITLLFISLLVVSCGNSEKGSLEEIIKTDDLTAIKSKKMELSKQQSELTAKIDQLDAAIDRLDPNKNLALIRTEVVNDTVFNHYTEVQGDVATKENILIYPEYSGLLTRVYVKEGDRVTKGQTLAKIDDGGLSSQLAQIEAQASLAKTTFDRQKRLWEQNIGSEIQYLETKTTYEAAQNSVNQLKSQLGKTTVRAPFSGVIDEVISDQGQVVSPGQNQLFRLVNLDNMYVQASVPENYLNQIKTGTSVIVEIGAIGKQFEGKVRQVGNFINPNNRTFQIEVAIPNEEGLVKPNLIATVKLNDYSAENAVVIPENTIQKNSMGESLVYILEPESDSTGVAKRVKVETGYSYGASVEVTNGLKPGDLLITEGGKNLRDQQKVKIKN